MKTINTSQILNTIMKQPIFMLAALLMFSAVQPAAGQQQAPSETVLSQLNLKQYYIALSAQGEGDGSINLVLFSPGEMELTTDDLLELAQKGRVQTAGVRLLTDHAERISDRRVSIPFEFDQFPEAGHLATTIGISGSDGDISEGELSLYPGTRTVVLINRADDQITERRVAVTSSGSDVAGLRFIDGRPVAAPDYGYVYLPSRIEPDSSENGSFVYRNRFWLAGAATAAIGSGAAVIFSGTTGSSVVLPPPPGRP